jgi:hypothetical protein
MQLLRVILIYNQNKCRKTFYSQNWNRKLLFELRLPTLSELKCVRKIIKGDTNGKKFMKPHNTTKFLFKNEDKILLIKESIETSHLISNFT